ncbi:MAG: (2Fe-2S) ferredoxin domain-containing protein [Oscillospiraceae bacterium]|nr:(2Fe-2S) ferredoxin domain-containing protein [Oscillospiraceae bacterium]
MKTAEELQSIREKMKPKIDKHPTEETRIVVGMATCGIAAGAEPVYEMLKQEIKRHNLKNITVTKTGCIGVCRLEPIVEVYAPGQEKVTYVKMTPKRALRVVTEHLVNKNIVTRYTVGAAD